MCTVYIKVIELEKSVKRKKAALNALKRKVKDEKQKALIVPPWELPPPSTSIPPLISKTKTTNMAMDFNLRQQLEDKALGDAIEVWDFLHVFRYFLYAFCEPSCF